MSRRLAAEFIGTLLLLATVVGSGIMGEQLADGNDAIALLGNTIATGAILVVLILMFGALSGAHFNPAVTLAFLLRREISLGAAVPYWVVQVAGGLAGMALAHGMFDQPVWQFSTNARSGAGQWLAEAVATFGLVATILAVSRFRSEALPYAVGLYNTAGYWVYGLDFVCQPRRHHCPLFYRYVFGHSARTRAGLHPGATAGSGNRNLVVPLAARRTTPIAQASRYATTAVSWNSRLFSASDASITSFLKAFQSTA